MMNVSASGGLSANSANSHRNGHSGRGLAPLSVGSGGPLGPLGPTIGRDDDHHDHRKRREEHVAEHGVAEEGHAALEFFVILGVVVSGDRPSGPALAVR